MNIYQSLNEIVNYIEQNLEEKIDYQKLAKILGVNEYTMQSVFNLICNVSLSEYIRNRRLSNAGYDLYHTNHKIMDIALKYQYDNATSFSRAFEKFHGIKPSQVKRIPEKLKIYTQLHFKEMQQSMSKKTMEYSIIQMPELILYGKGMKTTKSRIGKDAPIYYKKIEKKYESEYGFPPYGMTIYQDRFESEAYEYWVLYDKPINGFVKYSIPKSKWLVFKIYSYDSKELQTKTHQFYEEFIPSCKYNLRPLPELEYYHDNGTDFMVPIED